MRRPSASMLGASTKAMISVGPVTACAEPFLLDGAVVDEDVLTAIHGDEAVALLRVEPLHRACNHCGLAPFLASYRYRHIRAVPVRTRISCDFSGVNPTPRRVVGQFGS